MSASLAAQPRVIDRKTEAERYPDLRTTERVQERNILLATERFNKYWYLVDMARVDRKVAAAEAAEKAKGIPPKFENTFRLVKYTPRNVYIRYIRDIENLKKDGSGKVEDGGGNMLLYSYGDPENIKKLYAKKLADAQRAKVEAKELTWNGRCGIELTQFEFIHRIQEQRRVAVGSRRKSLALFWKCTAENDKITLTGEKDKDGKDVYKVDLVVANVIHDHLANGVRHVQTVIDPTPLTESMDDVVILDRYNQKPTDITILGMMSNTPNSPHRLRFKQKFYIKLLDNFYRLYRMVDGYAKRDGDSYNKEVLEKLERGMQY